MNEALRTRKRENDNRKRFLYLQTLAYERKLREDIDPDSPEWMATYKKLEELDREGDKVFMEGLEIKHEIALEDHR